MHQMTNIFGQSAPGTEVLLTEPHGVLTTLGGNGALRADRFGALLTVDAGVTAFPLGVKEDRRVDVAAVREELPRPRLCDRLQWLSALVCTARHCFLDRSAAIGSGFQAVSV